MQHLEQHFQQCHLLRFYNLENSVPFPRFCPHQLPFQSRYNLLLQQQIELLIYLYLLLHQPLIVLMIEFAKCLHLYWQDFRHSYHSLKLNLMRYLLLTYCPHIPLSVLVHLLNLFLLGSLRNEHFQKSLANC